MQDNDTDRLHFKLEPFLALVHKFSHQKKGILDLPIIKTFYSAVINIVLNAFVYT